MPSSAVPPQSAGLPSVETSAVALSGQHNIAPRAVALNQLPPGTLPEVAAMLASSAEPTTIGSPVPTGMSTHAPGASTVAPSMPQPPQPLGAATDPRLLTAQPDRNTSSSSLSSPAIDLGPTDATLPSPGSHQIKAAQDATASSTAATSSDSAGSAASMPSMRPVQTHLSQMSSIPIAGSGNLPVAADPAMASLPTTPVLYCESPRLADSCDTENARTEGSEASSRTFFVAKDALSKQSGKSGTRVGAGARPAAVKSPLSERSVSQQLLHTQGSVNSSSIIDHGSGASAAAAAATAADLQAVSIGLPDANPTQIACSSQPGIPSTDAHTADLRQDLPLLASAGAIVWDATEQRRGSETNSTSVNALDVCGKANQGATVNDDAEMKDGVADSGPRAHWTKDPAAGDAGDSDSALEHNVRELVDALEGRLTVTGTLEGAISGNRQREGIFVATDSSMPASATGDSIVQAVDRSESIGSTSGMGNIAGSSSVSARDVIEVRGHAATYSCALTQSCFRCAFAS